MPPHARWSSLDAIKAVALLWICLLHILERPFGGLYIANPSNAWPPLAERLAQLQPWSGLGAWDWPATLLLWFGRAGDQGVQLFLIVSGFGLTWALLGTGGPGHGWRGFLWRRLSRIYPEYWIAHLMVVAATLIVGRTVHTDTSFLFSLLGIRVIPEWFYAVALPWWYIGLILQFYFVFPFLFQALRRLGPARFLLVALGVGLAIRTLGLWVFAEVVPEWGYLDAWSRGAVFVSRLPEFAFGMAFAVWAQRSPEAVLRRVRSPVTLALAAVAWATGMVSSAFLLGMGPALLLLGVGVFLPLLALFESRPMQHPVIRRPLRWVSEHTYSIFLIHFPVIVALIPKDIGFSAGLFLRSAAVVVATVVAALLLEVVTGWARRGTAHILSWPPRRRWALVGGFAAAFAGLVAAELWMRANDPREVNGWGERPALEPHPVFGWRLIPEQTTRLRWSGYDYSVTANALGFPGPLYAPERAAGTLRVMTTGDAFTGADGVDTAQAWPRLLERALAERAPDRPVEVLNFAMTGYGPEQYAAVVAAFVPQFRPDVLVVSLFVNDFADAGTSVDDFRRDIGFHVTPPDHPWVVVSLGHLFKATQMALHEVIAERILGRPSPDDEHLVKLDALRVGGEAADPWLRALVADRVREIVRVAESNGARPIFVLVPANVQVCGPEDLRSYPRHVDLADPTAFDLDGPQRMLTEIVADAGGEALDLRPALRGGGTCPYHPRNMHWTPEGHERVSAFVAEAVAERLADHR